MRAEDYERAGPENSVDVLAQAVLARASQPAVSGMLRGGHSTEAEKV